MRNKTTEDARISSGTTNSIKEQLKKATTEMLILFILSKKSMYTYEMMKEIERLSNGVLTFNTLYQAIYRLQSFKYIQESDKQLSEGNRVRVYFSITDTGREHLEKLIEEYKTVTNTINMILET